MTAEGRKEVTRNHLNGRITNKIMVNKKLKKRQKYKR
jgi:hypothetical protein